MPLIATEEALPRPQLPLYVLGACSLLNLVASRRLPDIVRGTPTTFLIPEQAATEIRYVRRGGGGADADEREPVGIAVTARKVPGEIDGITSVVAEGCLVRSRQLDGGEV